MGKIAKNQKKLPKRIKEDTRLRFSVNAETLKDLSEEYINDVSPYIDDMRVLQNIFNEFYLIISIEYRENTTYLIMCDWIIKSIFKSLL